jgi:DNA polymerase IIIc chi subunit
MSASLPAAESYIRFQLDQMSARNEHHKFEDIAVRIARRRISSNILVAIGPVSAGGDQKRDAESYYTRIPDELPHSTAVAAPPSTDPIVIACTTQKDDLKSKVLADLKGICSPDAARVEHVAFFSIHPIPVATVHDLQKTAREEHSVGLDVFSGDHIATLLAEPDLIWVAVHYLELPNHMVPQPEGEPSPEWYRELLDNLRATNGPEALTPGVQGEIIRGLRFATYDPTTNADLPEWLDFMGRFLGDTEDGNDTEIVFRTCYEMAVARLRGTGSIAGVEDLFRRALTYALSVNAHAVLDDAATLISYWGGSWRKGIAGAQATEIADIISRLREHTRESLDTTDPAIYPVRAASLTATMAFLYMMPDWAKVAEKHGPPEPVETDPAAGARYDMTAVDTSSLADREDFDLAQAMGYLRKLVGLLPRARAFPVETVTELFQFFAPAFLKYPDYTTVRDALDEATAAVHGESAKAKRSRDRAVGLIKAGQPLEALTELHDAKISWFHGETMHGAILIMRFIAQIYAELGLMYAAKLYSCTAASLAVVNSDTDIKSQTAKALLETMTHSQQAGCWMDAAAYGRIAVLARYSLLPDPFDYDHHPELGRAEMNATLELAAIRKYWPALEEPFIKTFDPSGSDKLISDGVDTVADAVKWSEAEFQELADDQVAGPVFGDLGPMRLIDFRALGVRWMLTFNNDRTTVLSAESFCAACR